MSERTSESAPTRGRPLKLRAAPRTEHVEKAELAMLPRLPDTRQELMAIAGALNADPAKSLHFGRDASEKTVESLDLTRFRVVAFATHGLIPGDLDGLTQPALALSAPEVAGGEGDGLLTVDKILALKLDADWVVCPPATPERGPAPAPRRPRGWAAPSSTRERGLSSSPTGPCTRPPHGN